jgi:cysteinyl-tRNA synthetase
MGRPGWHIECSAMSEKYLGKTFDIHGGGQDLIFPHHENEIAQSECAYGNKFANYWIHNGLVTVEGNKMAKSEGNFVTVNQLKENYQGEVIRLTMILTHYRQPLNWTTDNLKESKKTLYKWYNFFSSAQINELSDELVSDEMMDALKDDINTPKVIGILHRLFKKCKADDVKSNDIFLSSAQFLGLMKENPSQWLSWGKEDSNIDKDQIESLVFNRNTARSNGDYGEADRIRGKLDKMGVILEDKDSKTSWRLK